MQPAPSNEVAPIAALVYGLTPRERDVTQLCMAGRSTKHMAQSLGVAAYTVQLWMSATVTFRRAAVSRATNCGAAVGARPAVTSSIRRT